MADVKAAKIASLFAKVKEELAASTVKEYRSLLAKQKMSAEDFAAGMLQMALKKFDNQAQEEAIFEGLREKKYSGRAAEGRFKGKTDGGFGKRRRNFSDEGDRRDRKREHVNGKGFKKFDRAKENGRNEARRPEKKPFKEGERPQQRKNGHGNKNKRPGRQKH